MKKIIVFIAVYLFGVVINLTVIGKYYKVNFAYDEEHGKSLLKALSSVSFAATPAVIFVCYDSNREWCNKK